LREPKHSQARCPDYVDVIDLALMLKCNPQEIWEQWDQLWIERLKVVLEARRLAKIVNPTR
jgi:hypothetical protein